MSEAFTSMDLETPDPSTRRRAAIWIIMGAALRGTSKIHHIPDDVREQAGEILAALADAMASAIPDNTPD